MTRADLARCCGRTRRGRLLPLMRSAASVAPWWRRTGATRIRETEVGIAGCTPGQARGEHGCADVVIVVDLRAGLARVDAQDPPGPLDDAALVADWRGQNSVSRAGQSKPPRCTARWRPPAAMGRPAGDADEPVRLYGPWRPSRRAVSPDPNPCSRSTTASWSRWATHLVRTRQWRPAREHR